ncbi:MAG TPA: STM3941 family protein [Bacteroidales bacterium]|nr:STM3941 family protein [Bacteroidales bacterium]
METIEIYSGKRKSVLLLIGSFAFVVVGFWFLLEADNLTGWRVESPVYMRVIGIASILFFGLGTFLSIKRLIKSELSIIISPVGLNLNPEKSRDEFIQWSDITGFKEIKIHSTRIIIIGVNNPEYWLNNETGIVKKKLMQFNFNNYGSPFNIAAAGLDISSDELFESLNRYFNDYNKQAEQS